MGKWIKMYFVVRIQEDGPSDETVCVGLRYIKCACIWNRDTDETRRNRTLTLSILLSRDRRKRGAGVSRDEPRTRVDGWCIDLSRVFRRVGRTGWMGSTDTRRSFSLYQSTEARVGEQCTQVSRFGSQTRRPLAMSRSRRDHRCEPIVPTRHDGILLSYP